MGNFFDKIHSNEKGCVISPEIDEYLKGLGYKKDTPVACFHENANGLAKWYCGQLYDTHVCISKDKIFYYQEYECGGHVGDNCDEIPTEAIESLGGFQEFLKENFEWNKYLFDSNL